MNTFLYLSTVLILIALIFTEQRKRVQANRSWSKYADSLESQLYHWQQYALSLQDTLYAQSGDELPLMPKKKPAVKLPDPKFKDIGKNANKGESLDDKINRLSKKWQKQNVSGEEIAKRIQGIRKAAKCKLPA